MAVPASRPEPSLADGLLDELAALERTPEDDRWPGAVWPSPRAFEDARAFVRRLPDAAIPAPDIGLADDGEVNFLWKADGVHIDLGFYGTGDYSFFARGRDGRELDGENVPAAAGLRSEVVALFAD